MALGQWRLDVIEGVRKRADDLAFEKVGGAGLEVAGVGLQPFMVFEGDPVTKDMNRLWLAGKAGGQLLGDEEVDRGRRAPARRRSCRDR